MLIADPKRQRGGRRGKTIEVHEQVVAADGKVEKREASARIGHRMPGLVGRVVGNLHGGTRHHRAGSVADGARYGRRRHRLATRDRRRHQQDAQKDQPRYWRTTIRGAHTHLPEIGHQSSQIGSMPGKEPVKGGRGVSGARGRRLGHERDVDRISQAARER